MREVNGTGGEQYFFDAFSIIKSSSSEFTPEILPSSTTPINSLPPSVFANATNERAILAASLISNLKSRYCPSPSSINRVIMCFFTIATKP